MQNEQCRNLTFEEADALHAKALTGDEQAVRDFLCYSAYRVLKHDFTLTPAERIKSHEKIMGSVKITVIKDG